MLQRGPKEGICKFIAGKTPYCKISYGTVAKAVGDSEQNELNAFISLAELNPGNKPPDDKDVRTAGNHHRFPPSMHNIAVKDNITTIASGTTCGSGILREYRSPFEADVVSRLRLGGASVYGKTNLDEFGMGSHSTNSFYGPVKNVLPFDGFSAGGSSGGSAVAVASGKCLIALGTDTGGSVRLPAAYTGVVGFKPSYGLLSRWGVIPYANSMDTVGIMASCVENLRKTFHWAFHHDRRDPTSVSKKSFIRLVRRRNQGRDGDKLGPGIRIGVPLEYNIAELEPGIRQAWRNCLKILQNQGATIVPVSLPNTKHALSAYYVLAPAEAASNLSKYDGVRYGYRARSTDGADDVLYSRTRGEGFGDEVKRRILLGSYTLSSEAIDNYFLKAQKVRRLVQRDFDRAFSAPNPLRPPQQFNLSDMDESIHMSNKLGPTQVDFIVCPTAPTLPPTLDVISNQTPVDSYMNDVFTVPASLAGLPAISIPFPIPEDSRSEGKPVLAGMQIIGQYSSDYKVIAMAEELARKLSMGKSEKLERELGRVWIGQDPSMSALTAIAKEMRESRKLKKTERSGSSRRILENRPLIRRVLSKMQVREVPTLWIKKFLSRKGKTPKSPEGEEISGLLKGKGEILLYYSEKGYRFGMGIPGNKDSDRTLGGKLRKTCIDPAEERLAHTEEEIRNGTEKPLEEKIRRVSVVQPEGRVPLTEKEINKAFEEAWVAWLEQTR